MHKADASCRRVLRIIYDFSQEHRARWPVHANAQDTRKSRHYSVAVAIFISAHRVKCCCRFRLITDFVRFTNRNNLHMSSLLRETQQSTFDFITHLNKLQRLLNHTPTHTQSAVCVAMKIACTNRNVVVKKID